MKPNPAVLALAAVMLFACANASSSTCNVTSGSCALNLTGTGITFINSTGSYGKPINIVFAYAPGCPHCEALNGFMANLSSRYELKVTYLNAVSNQSLLSRYLQRYNVSQQYWDSVPILFVNGTYCAGDTPCEAFLSNNIAAFALSGTPVPSPGIGGLGGLTVAELTGLALVDSINPCAFAVLIFFLSTLFMRDPNKRYRILLGGISFALGIFVFYLAIGVLLLLGIKSALAVANLKSAYVYAAFGVIALALGALNVIDYFSKKGFIVKVPTRWKPNLNKAMTRFVSVPAAFIAGVLVTAFLLPCITGPYFVAGSLLKSLPLATASLWLAYYNALFVLPMLIITALVYASFTSIEKAHAFREKNTRKLRLIAGILLIVVGVTIILQMAGLI
jgi:thiol-disulfide isomerase/thioredoxin/uncharacterized membrane protein HdeD (DUF308 family)